MLVSLLACFTAQARDQPTLDELRAMTDRGNLWAWKTIGINNEAEGNLSVAFAYYHYVAINGKGIIDEGNVGALI